MKTQNPKKRLAVTLAISLLFNVVLFLGIWFIGGVKTNFFKRVGFRMGICEMSPKDRGDYWCIQGWTNTLRKLNYDADMVFFGNSITRGSSFHEFFPQLNICNLGYPGDDLDGMVFRVQQIKAVNPEKVFVMAGINGLQYQTEEDFEKKYQRMVDSIKKQCLKQKFFFRAFCR